ncbi:Origin recognition complex subunit 2-like [Homarus americanus]|uniref:Origin recognition complex subunit 2 n=1 Tax=Homarus americanus TaxID=6706 RepID=A0A8J5K8B0_HOMAM|nr:Origin recognition complex subunit 2-like [Homarus americanus]
MMPRRARTTLSVTFINDKLVDKISNGTDGKKVTPIPLSQRGRSRHRSAQTPAGDNDDLPQLEEMDEGINDVFFKPTELFEDGEDPVKGSAVFGFRTPKKKWGMLEKAGSAKMLDSPSTPKIPRSSLKHYPDSPRTPKTPRSSLKHYPDSPRTTKIPRTPNSAAKNGFRTPKSHQRSSEVFQEVTTPYNFRNRVKHRIKKIVCEEESSSEEDSDGSNYSLSESDDDDDNESKENFDDFSESFIRTPSRTPKRTPIRKTLSSSTPGKTPSRTPGKVGRGRKIKDVEMVGRSDEYFNANGDLGKVITSDHTLSRLETPRLAPDALQSILLGVTATHQAERKALIEEHRQMFPRWMTEGFSIFLYGFGSKKDLLSKFQQEYLDEYDHIVVNGFFPSLTLKNILNNITEDILDQSGSFHSIQEQLEFIEEIYSKPNAESLFIIIHNLDGPLLRGDKTQSAIAHLASITNVHLLASIDHINAPLIFDSGKMSSYNALWCDATTLAPYSEETSYENSLLVQQSGSLALSSLVHVFKSLTPNAKGIFLLLAKHQLDQKDKSNYVGLSFNDMYQRCREAFLVNSDLTLRAQLTEFKDHKLIRSKKGPDGIKNLLISLDSTTLQDFISQQELENL